MLIKRLFVYLEAITERHRVAVPIGLLLLALFPRVVAAILIPLEITHGDDPWYYLSIAESVFKGAGFSEGNLLAYRPPLYPLYITAIFAIFGEHITVVQIIQALMAAVSCVFVYWFSKRLFGFTAGFLAALFCALYPQFIHYSVGIWSEQLFTFLMLLSLFLLVEGLAKDSKLPLIGAGLAIGLAILTRDSAVFILFGYLIWILRVSESRRVAIVRFAAVAVCAVLVVMPWTIRNYKVFGKLVPVSTNGGINFYMGNNPDATGGFNWKLPAGAIWNVPSENGQNEINASNLGYQQGIQFIRDNPGRFVELIGARLYYLFRPPTWTILSKDSLHEVVTKIVWVVMYLALFVVTLILGLPCAWKQRGYFLSLLQLIAWLVLPFIVSYGGTRYRLPIEPLMAIISAAAISATCFGRKEKQPSEDKQIAV
ncbi:MAG: glycosyltransferase family 39 protein [Candidatus Zixiibacteriota bacterium]